MYLCIKYKMLCVNYVSIVVLVICQLYLNKCLHKAGGKKTFEFVLRRAPEFRFSSTSCSSFVSLQLPEASEFDTRFKLLGADCRQCAQGLKVQAWGCCTGSRPVSSLVLSSDWVYSISFVICGREEMRASDMILRPFPTWGFQDSRWYR